MRRSLVLIGFMGVLVTLCSSNGLAQMRQDGGASGRDSSRATVTQPPAREPETRPSDFAGRYFGYQGRTLHTWDFNPDGTFLHTTIVSGAGTNVRNSERGTFRVAGSYLEITVMKSASAFTTPSVGGRGTQTGGGADTHSDVRRVPFRDLGKDGIVIDGVTMKVKTW